MNDKHFDPVAPPFKPADSLASPPTRNLWGQESRKLQFSAPGMNDNGVPITSFKPGGITHNSEHLFSAGNMRSANGIFQSMYTTPPREPSFTSSEISHNTKVTPFNDSMRFNPSLIPGLLPDEEDSIQDKFSIKLGESTEEVIAGLKLQVETLVTAIMLTSGNSTKQLGPSSLQGADAIEISHRIMMRLKLLREENERLAQIANGTLAAKLEAKNIELESEVQRLRKQLAQSHGHMETDD